MKMKQLRLSRTTDFDALTTSKQECNIATVVDTGNLGRYQVGIVTNEYDCLR